LFSLEGACREHGRNSEVFCLHPVPGNDLGNGKGAFIFEWLMSGERQRNYDLILSAEDSFARAVALGIWVQRPLTVWHYLLPGMFLWDIIKRRMAIQQYSALFLFPRKLALDAARQMIEGDDPNRLLSRTENKVQVRILLDHYSRLLQAEGGIYSRLIRNTYGTLENYEGYLARLSAAEGEVDQGLAEIQGGTAESWDRLRAEQIQVAQLRKKEADRIFPEEG
jgi:hypothetical protein